MSNGQPERPDPLIGLRIGTYVVRSKIAEGGMGAVYEAVSDELHQRKVVKVLLGEYANHPVIRERFLREAKAAARLSGKPHIVKIDDIGTLPDGKQFMTMEYLRGRPLDVHLRQSGRVTPHHAFHIVAQIGRGLHELHQAGIIHRDLKPGNVFLTTTDDNPYHVVLIDLGIAHDASSYESQGFKTQTGMAMGTPGYMAPEQGHNAGSVTPAADLYALGVILWEMLFGTLPWTFESDRSYYFKQRTEVPQFPPEVVIPDAWRGALLSALAPEVERRTKSIYAFLAALASSLPGDERMNVPNGAQMMASFNKSMLRNAGAESETVRAPNAERFAPQMWTPARSTELPPGGMPIASPAAAALSPTPAMAPTANERPIYSPANAPEQRPTTLSASSGVAMSQPTSKPKAMPLIAIGLAVALVGGGATFVIMRGRSTQAAKAAASDEDRGPAPTTPGSAGAIRSETAAVTGPQPTAAPPASVTAPQLTPVTPVDAGAAVTLPAAVPVDAPTAAKPDASHVSTKHSTAPSAKPGAVTSPARGSAAHHGGTFDPDAVED